MALFNSNQLKLSIPDTASSGSAPPLGGVLNQPPPTIPPPTQPASQPAMFQPGWRTNPFGVSNPWYSTVENMSPAARIAYGLPGYQEDDGTMQDVDAALRALYRPVGGDAFALWMLQQGIPQGRDRYAAGVAAGTENNYAQQAAQDDYLLRWLMASPAAAGRNTQYLSARSRAY